MRNRAFTLIEMMVTLAIIAILLSILLPALGIAKIEFLAIDCQNNLRTNINTLTTYSMDHFGEVPKGVGTRQGSNYKLTMFYAWGIDLRADVIPYVTGKDGHAGANDQEVDLPTWHCPAVEGAVAIDDPANTRGKWMYGNYNYFPGSNKPTFDQGGTPHRIDMLANRVIMQDYDNVGNNTWEHNHSAYGESAQTEFRRPTDNPSDAFYDDPSGSSIKGATLAWGDGSVEFYEQDELEIVGPHHARQYYSRLQR